MNTPEKRKKACLVRMDEDIWEQVKDEASKEDRSMSYMMNAFAKECLERRKESVA